MRCIVLCFVVFLRFFLLLGLRFYLIFLIYFFDVVRGAVTAFVAPYTKVVLLGIYIETTRTLYDYSGCQRQLLIIHYTIILYEC